MSLIDDIKLHYTQFSYPPDGEDLDYEKVDGQWVERDTKTELVSEEDQSSVRWGTWFQNVYKRGDEYVAVTDCRPATEEQNWGDYGPPVIFPVKPVTETVVITKYVNVES